MRDFLRLREISEKTGVSIKTLLRWIKLGKLSAKQVGRCYFVTDEDYKKTFGQN